MVWGLFGKRKLVYRFDSQSNSQSLLYIMKALLLLLLLPPPTRMKAVCFSLGYLYYRLISPIVSKNDLFIEFDQEIV